MKLIKKSAFAIIGLVISQYSHANWSEAVKIDSIAVGENLGIVLKTTPQLSTNCKSMWRIESPAAIEDKLYGLAVAAYLSNDKVKIWQGGCASDGNAKIEKMLAIKNDLNR